MTANAISRLAMFARGVTVLDLTQYLPGPLASLLLADMGADIRKIEPPDGDPMRTLGPRDADGAPVFYEAINAGKTTQRLDLKDPEVRQAFLEQVRDADVLIEGFRPGTMKRLGFEYGTLRKINPALVYCSMSGWGQTGPQAQAAGHDGNYLAMAGVLHRNGSGAPSVFDPPVADTTAALFAVISILGALNARAADGCGCEIDLALADVVMPLQLFQIAAYGARGTVPQPDSTYLNGGAAYYRVYQTSDGRHVMLGAVETKFWRAFCETAGHPAWIERHKSPTPQHALIGEVAAFFRAMPLDACLARFEGVDCCLSPLLDLGEALQSPHFAHRDLVRQSPSGDLQALFPARIDDRAAPSRARLKASDAQQLGGAAGRRR